MGVSQFTRYSSSDASGPGLMVASNGGLCTVLKACLVDGYSGKTAAGWTQPFAITSSIGSFKPPLGSRMTLVVGDDGTGATIGSTGAAYLTGWETLAGVASPVGSGTGQFPLAAQIGSVGALMCYKANAGGGATRSWVLFADGYGFYLFTDVSATGGAYTACGFSDLYSLNPTVDTYRTAVYGNGQSSISASNSFAERLGVMYTPGSVAPWTGASTINLFTARTMGGGGTSTQTPPAGDNTLPNTTGPYAFRNGASPFGPANVQMLNPIKVYETSGQLRGFHRGMFHSTHPASNYANGMIIPGGGDYAGKTFECIGPSWHGGAFWIVETSNTVLTNT